MRRLIAVLATAALALTLGGCSMTTTSRLDEYAAATDALMADTVAVIPTDLVDEVGFSESEPRYESPLGAGSAEDAAWWQALESIVLVSQSDASADAAAAITEHLVTDGWTTSRVRETDGGRRIADGFRREIDGGDWYIELTWVMTAPDKAEVVEVLVVSPQTVRGDA
ncbi:hypothetical protein [Microbacterium sp. NPDC055357]